MEAEAAGGTGEWRPAVVTKQLAEGNFSVAIGENLLIRKAN